VIDDVCGTEQKGKITPREVDRGKHKGKKYAMADAQEILHEGAGAPLLPPTRGICRGAAL